MRFSLLSVVLSVIQPGYCTGVAWRAPAPQSNTTAISTTHSASSSTSSSDALATTLLVSITVQALPTNHTEDNAHGNPNDGYNTQWSDAKTVTEEEKQGGYPSWPNSPSLTTTSPSTTYTNEQITITSAPNWGDQKIPINTCTIIAPMGDIQWIPCMVFAGTVQLSFFPEAHDNISYPRTYYDPALSITLTSPSIYMIINTLTAYNSCGRVGPTYKDFIISMDLTDVSTMQPYPDATARDRLGDPRQLTLADLATDCPKFSDRPEGQTLIHSSGAIIDEHPIDNDWNRCNPRLMMPPQMKSVGLPYWRHCGNDNGHFGIFDPPGAVPPVQGIFPSTKAIPVTTTPPAAQPAPTIVPAPAPTAVPVTQGPTAPDPVQEALTPSSLNPALPLPPATPTSNLQPAVTINNLPNPAPPTSPGIDDQPTQPPPNPLIPVPDSILTVIGSNTLSADASGLILPGGLPLTAGFISTLADANNNNVVISVAASGIYVGTGTSAIYIAKPTIEAAVGVDANIPTPIATIGGEVIHAVPGASTVVIKDQTLTAGAAPVTLAGTNNIAVLGNSVLIIQYPGGVVSYFTLPTAASSPITQDGTANDIGMSLVPGESAIVIGTQTISLGGSVATISENGMNAVVSMANSGVIIQRPGGIVSTVPLTEIGVAVAPTSKSHLGDIIASIAGIAPPAQPNPATVDSTHITSSSVSTTQNTILGGTAVSSTEEASSYGTFSASTPIPSINGSSTLAPPDLQGSVASKNLVPWEAFMRIALGLMLIT
ncbi:hypothetical protein B0O99DRAFT_375216 [Bisporella sp. PMI_857]|nr:hypothetical protein B0O99DRAFT_375216 [Bisporella sp. PMI_857]